MFTRIGRWCGAKLMDKLTPLRRSENMRRIRSKDTQPELAVRKLVHRLGYRFRLHAKSLPGNPDLVFPSRRKIILVHGCFWHQHASPSCKITRQPKSNLQFWEPKLRRTIDRDATNHKALLREGWRVLTVWECEVRDIKALTKTLTRFLR